MQDIISRQIKPIDQLVFSDDFMFGAVMRDAEICKGVLERLLQIKIDHIEYLSSRNLLAHSIQKKVSVLMYMWQIPTKYLMSNVSHIQSRTSESEHATIRA